MKLRRPFRHYTLEEVRKDLEISQIAVANALDLKAPATHKAERSADPRLSTIENYVHALGRCVDRPVTLELTAVIGRARYQLRFPRQRGEEPAWSESASPSTAIVGRRRPSQSSATRHPLSAAARGATDTELIALLSPAVVALARPAVERAARRADAAGRHRITLDDTEVDAIAELFDHAARTFGRHGVNGVTFGGRSGEPGLWHFLNGICELEDTNRWNEPRKAVVAHLVATGRWRRIGDSPRGSEFDIGDGD